MTIKLTNRQQFFGIFALCAVALAFGLYLQFANQVMPCPMCILQRYGLLACALIALVAAVHNPRTSGIGWRVYGIVLALVAIAAGSISARQTWLQHNPPGFATCGPGLEYMVDRFPLSTLLPKIFRGEGDCSRVDWTMFGLSLAELGLIAFTCLCLYGLWQTFRTRR